MGWRVLAAAGVLLAFLVAGFVIEVPPSAVPAGASLPQAPPAPRQAPSPSPVRERPVPPVQAPPAARDGTLLR